MEKIIKKAHKGVAENSNLTYKIELSKAKIYAFVDAEALTKILSNLISNAFKYCAETVIVELMRSSTGGTTFSIDVKNDGFLIPIQMKEKIFEPFFRLKCTEKQPGTGIGLSLARSLAELHNSILVMNNPLINLNIFNLTFRFIKKRNFVFKLHRIHLSL